MKKLFVALAAVASVAAFTVGGVAANSDAGTVVDSGFACNVLDNNGNSLITYTSTLTLYQNKAVLKCSSNDAGTGKALQYFNYGNTGLECGMLDFGFTQDWSDKVGYNGNSQLTCTVGIDGRNAPATSGAGVG